MANEIKGIFDYIREGLGEQISPIGSAYEKFLELPVELRQGLISQDFRQEVENLKDPYYDEQVDGFQGIAGHQQIGGQEMISGTDPTDYGLAGGENRSALGNYGNRTLLGMADVMTQPDVLAKELVDVGEGLIQKFQGVEGTEQVAKADGLIDAVKNFDFYKSLYQGGGALDLTAGGLAVAPFIAKRLKGLPAGMSVKDISKEAPTNEGYFMRSTDVLLNDPKFAGKEAIAPQSLITVKKDGDIAGELRNSGVSVQEMKEIGLIDFIEQKRAEGVKKIPKQELIDFIEENKPTVAPKYVNWADEQQFGETFDYAFMGAFDVYGEGKPTAYIDYDLQDLTPSDNFYSGYYDGVEVRALDNAKDWKEGYQAKRMDEQKLKQRIDTPNASQHRKIENHNLKVKSEIERDLRGFYNWAVEKYNSRPENNPYSAKVNPDNPNDNSVYLNPKFKEKSLENGGIWSPANRRELDKIIPQASNDIDEYLDTIYKKNGKEYEWKMGDYVIRGKGVGDKELLKLMPDGKLQYIDNYSDIESLEGAIKNRLQQDAGVVLPKYGTYTAHGKSSDYEEIPVVVNKKDFKGFDESGLSLDESYRYGGIHPLGTDQPYLFHLRSSTRKDLSGNKFYYIEELQSDWHQKGRKRGFKDSPKVEEARKLMDEPDYLDKKEAYFNASEKAQEIGDKLFNNYSHVARNMASDSYDLDDVISAFNDESSMATEFNTDFVYEAIIEHRDKIPKAFAKGDLEKVPFKQILEHIDELPKEVADEIIELNKWMMDDPIIRRDLPDVMKLVAEEDALYDTMKSLEKYSKARRIVENSYPTKTPPFAKELWSKVGLRQGLTRAIDKGLDKMAWTNADIQTRIYDPQYIKLYQNTYEKNMPRQARELLKELGVDPDKHLKKTRFDMEDYGEQEVWYIDITPELKSKLIDMQGNVRQPLYSSIGGAGIGGGLLATDPSNSDNINPNKGLLA